MGVLDRSMAVSSEFRSARNPSRGLPPAAADPPEADGSDEREPLALPRVLPRLKRDRLFRALRPVLLSGAATALLFLGVDHGEPWSVGSALLGLVLLGTILARQIRDVLALEAKVSEAAARLSGVSELVAELNSNSNVGNSMGMVLDRMLSLLDAGSGAVWLPLPRENDRLCILEHRGIDSIDDQAVLLQEIRLRLLDRVGQWQVESLPSAVGQRCLAARMGLAGEDLGFLTVLRPERAFSPTEAAILRAVATDIGGSLRCLRLVSEARRLADKDPLTGLLNHRTIHQRLQSEQERQPRDPRPVSLIMIDMDNFKLFNDTYGHPAGDDVLRRVGAVLRRACRTGDAVARYGGDEFLLLLPGTPAPQAVRCAERIHKALARERFRFQNGNIPIRFSCGVATFPSDTDSFQQLVPLADSRLYHSKAAGGDCITAQDSANATHPLMQIDGFELLRGMLHAIDAKDNYTLRHCEAVTKYALEIGRILGLSDAELETLQIAGLLLDIGKIGVPDEILMKTGCLTDEEAEAMSRHPVFGAVIVSGLPDMADVVLGVRHHHECYDGTGYPDRLAGQAIPLVGRILAVADAYAALTADHPYRKSLTATQALEVIEKNVGTQFDPFIGTQFVHVCRRNLQPPAPKRRSTRAKPDKSRATPAATAGSVPETADQAVASTSLAPDESVRASASGATGSVA
jgi:diguanylate cyclase (GGDEF)-like protein